MSDFYVLNHVCRTEGKKAGATLSEEGDITAQAEGAGLHKSLPPPTDLISEYTE